MEYKINNNNFSDISLIEYKVYYSSSSYIKKSLIKIGSIELNEYNFLETDFKYIQDKISFSKTGAFDNLSGSDKSAIQNKAQVEKYLLTLFPTQVTLALSSNTNFFNTYIDSKGNEIMCVKIPEGIDEVGIFDYWDARKQPPVGTEKEPSVLVTFEGDEIEFSKILYMMTSYSAPKHNSNGEKVKTILNLSYISYLGDKNGVRKMSDYVLRNDSLVRNYKGYHEECGLLFSDISGSLIGTEKLEERPLYDLLKPYSVTEDWNKSKRYSIGDTVRLGNTEYESLESDNIGNHPHYSYRWAVK